jgi:hypothetical protein
MLIEARIKSRRQVGRSHPVPIIDASAPPAWVDTLAVLARSHRIRLAASDPSRPWLSVIPPPKRRPRT